MKIMNKITINQLNKEMYNSNLSFFFHNAVNIKNDSEFDKITKFSFDSLIDEKLDEVKSGKNNALMSEYSKLNIQYAGNDVRDQYLESFDHHFKSSIKTHCALLSMENAVVSQDFKLLAKKLSFFINKESLLLLCDFKKSKDSNIPPLASIKKAMGFCSLRNDVRLDMRPDECWNDTAFILSKRKTIQHLHVLHKNKGSIAYSVIDHMLKVNKSVNNIIDNVNILNKDYPEDFRLDLKRSEQQEVINKKRSEINDILQSEKNKIKKECTLIMKDNEKYNESNDLLSAYRNLLIHAFSCNMHRKVSTLHESKSQLYSDVSDLIKDVYGYSLKKFTNNPISERLENPFKIIKIED